MGFGALRSILRPVSRTLLSAHCTGSSFSLARTPAAASGSSFFGGGCPLHRDTRQMPVSSAFHSLTDNRFPKRRPSDKPRRKRASLRPPALKSNAVDLAMEMQVHMHGLNACLAEAKKRKAQLQEANREKVIKRVERKMAAVARDRAWAEKLAELQRLEEEKKKKVMA
ncbi:hypothetical protein RHSIM_Rhsim08G0123600 [Rhododendron simsii]|uniref:Uncharacterized protein n=1 Tax=Rhododendron simsii TaxID=118357 RepID=A0A834GN72_RHOSS|nr:hypothetical protein RHSIM_Rhsim08G0123600 [Rhododendron simsii]